MGLGELERRRGARECQCDDAGQERKNIVESLDDVNVSKSIA